jgi:hypothetical protein
MAPLTRRDETVFPSLREKDLSLGPRLYVRPAAESACLSDMRARDRDVDREGWAKHACQSHPSSSPSLGVGFPPSTFLIAIPRSALVHSLCQPYNCTVSNPPCPHSIRSGHTDAITSFCRLLLQYGCTALYRAASYGQRVVVGLLLEVGAAVNATNKVRPTPSSD